MQFELFMKSWKAKNLSDEEYSNVIGVFTALNKAINNNDYDELKSVSPICSALYFYALQTDENLREILNLSNSFLSDESDFFVPINLKKLIGQFWIEIQYGRLESQTNNINLKKTLAYSMLPADYLSSLNDTRLNPVYENKSDKLNIDFSVNSLPFPLEVLDPRIVRIPGGKSNEYHKHAHETVFIFIQGNGHVQIDNLTFKVQPGNFVFIPRWCMHQTTNDGETEMIFLAVADFGLTGKSFMGNYLKSARLKQTP